jgi:protein-disulfide isomerase
VLLGVVDASVRSAARDEAERDRSEAAERIIQQSRRGEFTGRYRVGPAEAPIRIVMFTDYQCGDCANVERQLKRLHETRDDLSISIKHFPFNSDCNQYITRRVHSNACWAARAAEAAGILWGPEGFWKMHEWLFGRRGRFESNEVLENGIRSLGYDPEGFVSVMTSDETLAAVSADIEEAHALGLHFTPMIYINGVELKGWNAPEALIRTVEEVAATNPPARSAASDRPPLALDKAVDDWRFQPELTLPPDEQPWVTGAGADARVRVVVWGDYQESGTARADSTIRGFASGRNDVSYAFRHFPFNSECNPKVEDQRHPLACMAARAAEAAGALGGNEAYWRMHSWLMENPGDCGEAGLKGRATEIGLDADAFWAAMRDPASQKNILDDVAAGDLLPQLRHGAPKGIFAVPSVFVNERYIPRPWINGQSALTPILEEAARP